MKITVNMDDEPCGYPERAGKVIIPLCPRCHGYCMNGAQCAISQFLCRRWDWRSRVPVDLP